MGKLYQCPYSEATKCAMITPCLSCENFEPNKLQQIQADNQKLWKAINAFKIVKNKGWFSTYEERLAVEQALEVLERGGEDD